MEVLIYFRLTDLGFFLINVPEINLTVECTTSQDKWISWMELDASQTVTNFDSTGWLGNIKVSPKNRPDAYSRVMFTPNAVIGLTVSNS